VNKVRWTVGKRIQVEAEGHTAAELFDQLATLVEVFGAESQCAFCKNEDLRPVVRTAPDKNKHYELHCTNKDCRARFVFGQHKEPKGSLFPQRKVGKGDKANWKPNRGWEKYVPEGDK
jgi:hypothetical protein